MLRTLAATPDKTVFYLVRDVSIRQDGRGDAHTSTVGTVWVSASCANEMIVPQL